MSLLKLLLAILVLLVIISAGCNGGLPECTYPQVNQLNKEDIHLDWCSVGNPDWGSSDLAAKVIELSEEYRATNGQGVCWDMAVDIWYLLKDNGITSILAAQKTETESWGKVYLALSHVWVIVFGKDNTIIPIEYGIPRLPGESRYSELLSGYFYPDPETLSEDYPELFLVPK